MTQIIQKSYEGIRKNLIKHKSHFWVSALILILVLGIGGCHSKDDTEMNESEQTGAAVTAYPISQKEIDGNDDLEKTTGKKNEITDDQKKNGQQDKTDDQQDKKQQDKKQQDKNQQDKKQPGDKKDKTPDDKNNRNDQDQTDNKQKVDKNSEQDKKQSEDKKDNISDNTQNGGQDNKTDNKQDNKQSETIPSKFDLRDKIDIRVEDQRNFGLCWAFSSMTVLETHLALTQGKNYDFSEIHLDYMMSKLLSNQLRDIHQGGGFDDFIDYALAFGGFVLEDDLEYRDFTEEEYASFRNMKKVDENIYDIVSFPTYDPIKMDWTAEQFKEYQDAIKKHIMNFGALQISIYFSPENENDINIYYRDYDDMQKTTDRHCMTIIGWDDAYSKENFKSPNGNVPKNDGAYLVLNSWGANWGNQGYGWISYEDYNVHRSIYGIVSTDPKDLIDLDAINNNAIVEYLEEKHRDEIKYVGNKKYINKVILNKEFSIDLSGRNMSSLDGLEIFPEIYQLNLSNNHLKDISKISEFKEVWNLDLSNNPELTDISVLKDMEHLARLDLSGNKNITNLSIIKDLKVTELYLRDCSIKDLNQILPDSLETIDLSKNKEIEDYNPLNDPIFTSTVILQDCDIADASVLNQLGKICTLDLSHNKGITNIDQLPSGIGYLGLNDCGISDLSEIEQLQIYGLELRDNNLGDVSSLKYLAQLDLSGNKNVCGDFRGGNIQELQINDCEKDKDFDFFGLTTVNHLYSKGNSFSISDALEKVTCGFSISGDKFNYSDLADLPGENLKLQDTDIYYKIKVPKGNIEIELRKMFGTSLVYSSILCEKAKINRTFGYIELNAQENGQIILPNAFDFEKIGSECRIIIDYEVEENLNPIGILVTKLPDRTKFKTDEDIVTTGMEVSEVYDNGIYKKTDDYEVIIPDKKELTYGHHKITVKQKDLSATYTIEYGTDEMIHLDIDQTEIYEDMIMLVSEKCPDALIEKDDEDLSIRIKKSELGTVQNMVQKELRFSSPSIRSIDGLAPLDLAEIHIDVVSQIPLSDLEKLHKTFPNLKVLYLRDVTPNGEFGENAIEGEQHYFDMIYTMKCETDDIIYLELESLFVYSEMSKFMKEKCPDALIEASDMDWTIKIKKSAIGTIQNEFWLESQAIQCITGLEPLDLTEINIEVKSEKLTQSDLEKLHQTFPNLKVLHLKDVTPNGEFKENAIEGEQNYFEVIYSIKCETDDNAYVEKAA